MIVLMVFMFVFNFLFMLGGLFVLSFKFCTLLLKLLMMGRIIFICFTERITINGQKRARNVRSEAIRLFIVFCLAGVIDRERNSRNEEGDGKQGFQQNVHGNPDNPRRFGMELLPECGQAS